MSRELDKAVAEALGYRVEVLRYAWGTCTHVLYDPGGVAVYGEWSTEELAWGEVPHFSTEMAEAWKLVDYAIAKGWEFGLWYDDYDKKWVCQMYLCEGQGDTAAEAIARAFDNAAN